MTKAGQRVFAHYRGMLDDGTEFDNTYNHGEPIDFVVGVGQMIPGFDNAVLSMELGETKTVKIPCAEAYGEYNDQNLQSAPLDLIPNSEMLPLGEYIFIPMENGEMMRCKVLRIENGEVTFDFNHELAGKDLTFEIQLISVTD